MILTPTNGKVEMSRKLAASSKIRLVVLACASWVLWGLSGCMEQQRYVVADIAEWELRDHGEPYRPEEGYVPDADTAVRIAEAVLERAYGSDMLNSQRPLRVMLADTHWIIVGTIPEDALGGVVRIDIERANGTILRVEHGE